jgi:hypothetical protein
MSKLTQLVHAHCTTTTRIFASKCGPKPRAPKILARRLPQAPQQQQQQQQQKQKKTTTAKTTTTTAKTATTTTAAATTTTTATATATSAAEVVVPHSRLHATRSATYTCCSLSQQLVVRPLLQAQDVHRSNRSRSGRSRGCKHREPHRRGASRFRQLLVLLRLAVLPHHAKVARLAAAVPVQ